MAMRSVCLCDGEYIGIESINVPEDTMKLYNEYIKR